MGFCTKCILFGSLTAAIIVGFLWHKLTKTPEIPNIQRGYWGPLDNMTEDLSIRPFTIDVPQFEIDDLLSRLTNTRRLAKPLEGVAFEYGFNTNYLKKLVDYWKKEYNWKERQDFLNQYPQFKTKIAGLDIHFIHIKQANPKGLPVVSIMYLHGFPNSMRVVYDFIPFIMNQTLIHDRVFHIIIPTMPGFGWSEAPRRPGLGPAHIGKIFVELMTRLGYDRFISAGGNWGFVINYSIAVLHPGRVIGFHCSGCFVTGTLQTLHLLMGTAFPEWLVGDHSTNFFRSQVWKLFEESGYWHFQSTKPDTIGIGLNDSPAGLAAYLLEKFSTWSNVTWKTFADGGLDNFDKDLLIDNVMVFWVTKSITSAMRLYANAFSIEYLKHAIYDIPTNIPFSCMMLDGDFFYVPKSMLRWNFHNLTQHTNYHKGGHFVNVEMPEVYAKDIIRFVQKVV